MIDRGTARRGIGFFLPFFAIAVAAGIVQPPKTRLTALVMVGAGPLRRVRRGRRLCRHEVMLVKI